MTEKKEALLRLIMSRKMLVTLVMGFSCGLPLLLTMGVLKAWMKEEGVDLSTIGLISLVQIPYTWKFLWAPIMDKYTLPFLGRRRGWLIVAQVILALCIAGLGMSNPGEGLTFMVAAAILVAFFSSTQDIVVDAYRREDLDDEELGLGSSLYIYGYRVGMLLASGGGLILADNMTFQSVYFIMAGFMAIGIVTTLLTPEPEMVEDAPKTLSEAVFSPLIEYFSRDGAVAILAFILLYKIGDAMAGAITIPFYLDVGFTKTEIGQVVKIFGLGAVLLGAFAGGVAMLRLGINKSLWIFGTLQALSTACFAVLTLTGPSIITLSFVIAFENISSGMGTAAYIAFMASITNKKFTATQYALLTSLMGIPRVIAAAPTGYMAENMGWMYFFISCAIIAVPGMLLLTKFAPWSGKSYADSLSINN